jgi:hypothetical protein
MCGQDNNPIRMHVPSSDLVNCTGAETCVELYDSQCVVYNGPALTQISTTPGERLQVILENIATAIGSGGSGGSGGNPILNQNSAAQTSASFWIDGAGHALAFQADEVVLVGSTTGTGPLTVVGPGEVNASLPGGAGSFALSTSSLSIQGPSGQGAISLDFNAGLHIGDTTGGSASLSPNGIYVTSDGNTGSASLFAGNLNISDSNGDQLHLSVNSGAITFTGSVSTLNVDFENIEFNGTTCTVNGNFVVSGQTTLAAASVTSAPINPSDVVRLQDLGSLSGGIQNQQSNIQTNANFRIDGNAQVGGAIFSGALWEGSGDGSVISPGYIAIVANSQQDNIQLGPMGLGINLTSTEYMCGVGQATFSPTNIMISHTCSGVTNSIDIQYTGITFVFNQSSEGYTNPGGTFNAAFGNDPDNNPAFLFVYDNGAMIFDSPVQAAIPPVNPNDLVRLQDLTTKVVASNSLLGLTGSQTLTTYAVPSGAAVPFRINAAIVFESGTGTGEITVSWTDSSGTVQTANVTTLNTAGHASSDPSLNIFCQQGSVITIGLIITGTAVIDASVSIESF